MESYSLSVWRTCVWLLSLSVMLSRVTRVAACVSASFLFMAESYSIEWIYHIGLNPFIRWWTLDGFHFLAVMNNTSLSICIQVFVWMCVPISLGYVT